MRLLLQPSQRFFGSSVGYPAMVLGEEDSLLPEYYGSIDGTRTVHPNGRCVTTTKYGDQVAPNSIHGWSMGKKRIFKNLYIT